MLNRIFQSLLFLKELGMLIVPWWKYSGNENVLSWKDVYNFFCVVLYMIHSNEFCFICLLFICLRAKYWPYSTDIDEVKGLGWSERIGLIRFFTSSLIIIIIIFLSKLINAVGLQDVYFCRLLFALTLWSQSSFIIFLLLNENEQNLFNKHYITAFLYTS
jgi:hypothetical protein